MADMTVKVYLNETGGFMSYTPGDALHEALSMEMDMPEHRDIALVLESIFMQLNIDEPTEQYAIDYRARRNRSLSVGDVVVIGETAWTCASVGWVRCTNLVVM
jgi:hypothetical protein